MTDKAGDYSATLFLPQTDFPMRAALPEREPKLLERWEKLGLYQRLREYIDRSREMYDKRVRPEVAQRYDYFHNELVNTLAEGDEAKLGSAYPGATVSA